MTCSNIVQGQRSIWTNLYWQYEELDRYVYINQYNVLIGHNNMFNCMIWKNIPYLWLLTSFKLMFHRGHIKVKCWTYISLFNHTCRVFHKLLIGIFTWYYISSSIIVFSWMMCSSVEVGMTFLIITVHAWFIFWSGIKVLILGGCHL